jgi:tetratricopeptide (TPR) repeat protein
MAARTPPPPPGIKPTSGKPVEPAKKSGSGAMIGVVVALVIAAVAAYFVMGGSKVSAPSVTVSATENSVQVKTLLNNLLEFSSNNDWQKIEALTKELKAQSPFKKGDASASKSFVTEGEQALAAGNIQGAVDAFAKAVTADESNVDARVSWGYAQYRIGNHSQAITVLGQALVAEPDKARAWLYVAEVFAETGKDDPSLSATKLAVYFSKNRPAALNAIKTDTETIKSRKFGNLINKNMDGLTALPAR